MTLKQFGLAILMFLSIVALFIMFVLYLYALIDLELILTDIILIILGLTFTIFFIVLWCYAFALVIKFKE